MHRIKYDLGHGLSSKMVTCWPWIDVTELYTLLPASDISNNAYFLNNCSLWWGMAYTVFNFFFFFLQHTLSTQNLTKSKNEIFITAFVTEHLLNITSQSSYKYLMYFWQSLRETAFFFSSSEEHVLKKEGFMDIQYQCHSRSETSKKHSFSIEVNT